MATDPMPACDKDVISYTYTRMMLGAYNQYANFMAGHLNAFQIWTSERSYILNSMQEKLKVARGDRNQKKVRAAEEYIAQLDAQTFSQKSFILFNPKGDLAKTTNLAQVMYKRLDSALSVCGFLYTNPSQDEQEMLSTYLDAQKFMRAEENALKLFP